MNRSKLTALMCALLLLLLLCSCGNNDASDPSGSINNNDSNAFFEFEVSNVSSEISDDISETVS